MATFTSTNGTDAADTLSGNDYEVVFGGGGNDLFTDSAAGKYTILVGGAGDDTYDLDFADPDGVVLILATGGGSDTLDVGEMKLAGANTGTTTYLIDVKHLGFRVDETGATVVVLDYENTDLVTLIEGAFGEGQWSTITNFISFATETTWEEFAPNSNITSSELDDLVTDLEDGSLDGGGDDTTGGGNDDTVGGGNDDTVGGGDDFIADANDDWYDTEVSISPDVTVEASAGGADSDDDYYKFVAPNTGEISITLADMTADLDVSIRDGDREVLESSTNLGTADESFTVSVVEGETYYVKVSGFEEGVTDTTGQSNYSLELTYLSITATPTHTGTDGNDTMAGNDDMADYILGGDGSDHLSGGGMGDTLSGGAGADTLFGDGGNDTLNGEDGGDVLNGGGGVDRLRGGPGSDLMNGDNGSDILFGDKGADTLDGGNGTDTASYKFSGGSVTANLATGGTVGQAAGDVYVNIENLSGGKRGDHLTGDDNANKIKGFVGDDTIFGAGGDDRLEGNGGEDYLSGGTGDDTLTGGKHADTFLFEEGGGHDVITDFNVSEDILSVAAYGLLDAAAVEAAATMDGNNLVITIDDDTSITLIGVSLSQLATMNLDFPTLA